MLPTLRSLFALVPLVLPPVPAAGYELVWHLALDAAGRIATGRVEIGAGAEQVKLVDFRLGPAYDAIEADGELALADGRARWRPPATGGSLRYRVRIDERGEDGGYRSRFAADWALFRGDRVFPPARVRTGAGATARARLVVELPAGWSIVTPYPRAGDGTFRVEVPGRRFDRPIGWMLAGRIGVRRERIAGCDIAVAAPEGAGMRRMDVLAFLNYTLPVMAETFGRLPARILIVGAPDPMWRGGLAAPGSLYLHAERPLVSENGTSTLIHELTHVVTRIHGETAEDDWIAEGLAEYYAVEILHRSGGMTDARRQKTIAALGEWSEHVTTLRHDAATGAVTARAVLLFLALDEEIRTRTAGARTLDDVTRMLAAERYVSTAGLVRAAERVAGGPLETLATPLLERR